MFIKNAIFLGFLSAVFCVSANAAQMEYSNAEIYEKMCSKCHGMNAEGNPKKKGPALNDQTAHELELTLFELKSSGLNQSSGSEHEVMEHNMKKILQKGMAYDPKAMSRYIFTSFNPEAKYYKEIENSNKSFTVSEIYGKMCSKCHGLNAEGNPKKKGPALNEMTAHEIEAELLDIQNSEMNQSSGSEHEVMEHNQKAIEKKGMEYNPTEMAKYIQEHFYKK